MINMFIQMSPKLFIQLATIYLLLVMMSAAHAVAPLTLEDGTEISFDIQAASGNKLLLWIPSEAGPQASDARIAAGLAKKGIEVWRLDPVEARFLPVTQSSMDRIPAGDVAAIMEYAIAKTHKQIFIAGTGRAAIPILRGMQQWQYNHSDQSRLGGVMLLSPKFFVETPDPGEAARLMPIVTQTNLPLYLLQPKQSPWYWKLPITKQALERSGSSVLLQTVDKVRDRFYFRPDATDYERQQSEKLATWLADAASLLAAEPKQYRRSFRQTKAKPEVTVGKKDHVLQAYQGISIPPELRLKNLRGKLIDLKSYHGKVVLVNFWASWCPPCVHEMPSMQRLQDKYRKKGFVILGVNMADDKQTIANFLKTKVKVSFPILLDSDGAALRRWQVFAFPTSYVIDKKGSIRYALFGSLEWDTAETMAKINGLLKEK